MESQPQNPEIFTHVDYPIHIDTVIMKESILYFYGLQAKISIKWCICVIEDMFYLSQQCRPWWNATLCGISSGSSLLATISVCRYPEWKRLRYDTSEIYLFGLMLYVQVNSYGHVGTSDIYKCIQSLRYKRNIVNYFKTCVVSFQENCLSE